MSVVTDIMTAPFQGILDGVASIIGKFVKDPTAAMQAQVELAKLTNDGNLAILQADQAFAQAQAAVIQAEEKEGWLASNWRPIIMLMFGYIILNNYVLDPYFHIGALPIPEDLWGLLKIGIGGYVVGRSVEKFLPDTAASVAQVFAPKNTKP